MTQDPFFVINFKGALKRNCERSAEKLLFNFYANFKLHFKEP